PLERRTGVPSTRSLAIKLWDWRLDVSVCMVASIRHRTIAGVCDSHLRQHSTRNALKPAAVPTDQKSGGTTPT
ncbi:MAG TPA: hypothetical protein VFQ33_06095, partial [Xanthobacteraceae bacterium]|nr:hypothetical protein [Xanthobacteraceae bacterium]